MNRGDLQELSNLRIREARVLLKAGQYSGAYYLAGYAVECALKACIAKQTARYDFPELQKVRESFAHDLLKLAGLANLKTEIELESRSNQQFASQWTTVSNWNEKSRYDIYGRDDAEEMISAIITRGKGLLPWIKRYW